MTARRRGRAARGRPCLLRRQAPRPGPRCHRVEGLAIASEFELSEPTPVDPPTTVGAERSRSRRHRDSRCASQAARNDVHPSIGIGFASRSLVVGLRCSRASRCSPGACRRRVAADRSPPPTPRPTPTPDRPTPTRRRPPRPPAPTFVIYKVKSGDTLTSIAKEFKTDGRSIAYWSRVRHPSLDPESAKYAPDRLKVGWTLEILPGQAYVPPEDDGESGELTRRCRTTSTRRTEDCRRRVALTVAAPYPAVRAPVGRILGRWPPPDPRHASSSSGRWRPTPVTRARRAQEGAVVDAVDAARRGRDPAGRIGARGGSRRGARRDGRAAADRRPRSRSCALWRRPDGRGRSTRGATRSISRRGRRPRHAACRCWGSAAASR